MGSLGRLCVGVLFAVAGGLAAPIGPAAARGGPDAPATTPASAEVPPAEARKSGVPVIAKFEGRSINLVVGWEQARACMVRQGQVECFRDVAALELSAGAVQAAPAQLAGVGGYWCSSPLRLYEHSWYAGRQIMFYDRGYWQNLPDFGFNDQMTSYKVGGCTSYLAEHITGGGAWYPGPTAPYSVVGWPANNWDNRVSSVYLT